MMVEKSDPDHAFNGFYRKMMELVENNVPRKKITKKQQKREYKPWITKEIKKSLSE